MESVDQSKEQCHDIETILSKIGLGKFNVIFTLISGILLACDAMEVMVLAFLGPILHCEWHISAIEQSFLSTTLFLGMLLGGPVLSNFSDVYGRRPILLLSSITLAYVSLCSTLSPTVLWLTVLRGVMGALVATLLSTLSTIVAETMLVKYRAALYLIVQMFWPLGIYFITTICVLVVPTLGWRWFLGFSTFPLLGALTLVFWLPESPRFLLLNGCKTEALAVLNRIARLNNSEPVSDVDNPVQLQHSWRDLMHSNYRLTTLLTMLMWFSCGLCYYGSVILITIHGSLSFQCLQNKSSTSKPLLSLVDDSCCLRLSWSNYLDTYISTTGELIFIPLTYFLIDYVGRKPALELTTVSTALAFFCLNFCMPSTYTNVVLFILRGSISSSFNIVYLYAVEVFPTSVRNLALALCNSSSKLGAMIAPFVVNVLIVQYSYLWGTLVFSGCSLLTTLFTLLLPYETRNRRLYQTASDKIEVD